MVSSVSIIIINERITIHLSPAMRPWPFWFKATADQIIPTILPTITAINVAAPQQLAHSVHTLVAMTRRCRRFRSITFTFVFQHASATYQGKLLKHIPHAHPPRALSSGVRGPTATSPEVLSTDLAGGTVHSGPRPNSNLAGSAVHRPRRRYCSLGSGTLQQPRRRCCPQTSPEVLSTVALTQGSVTRQQPRRRCCPQTSPEVLSTVARTSVTTNRYRAVQLRAERPTTVARSIHVDPPRAAFHGS